MKKIENFKPKDRLTEFVKNYIQKAENPNLLEDILNHGLSSGIVPELIYYDDTNNFYFYYEEEIFNIILDEADSMGLSFIEFLGGCSYFKDIYTLEHLKNSFCWLAFELVAKRIYDFVNEDEEDSEEEE